jgi:hypothetical protein
MTRTNDLSDFALAKKFRQAVVKSRKKAGQKVGRAFVSLRRQRMGKADPRRKKGVISRVSRNGTLIVYDMAPMAHAQEFGAKITPTNKPALFIKVSDLRPGERPIRRGDYLLAVSKGTEPRLLGVYKTEVTIRQVSSTRRFFDQIEEFAVDYETALLKTFDEQDILL